MNIASASSDRVNTEQDQPELVDDGHEGQNEEEEEFRDEDEDEDDDADDFGDFNQWQGDSNSKAADGDKE